MRTSHSTSDIKTFSYQAFTLLFGDEFQNGALTLLSIFKGDLKRTFDSTEFIDHTHPDILKLKHLILKSGRIAFHQSLEAFIMGEVELSEFKEFEVSLHLKFIIF
jgi:hypothetical protein